jgi:HSP20 family protein
MRRQQGGLAPSAGFGPYAFPLFAGDLFRMSPFTLIRRMSEEMDRALGQPDAGQGNGAASTFVPNIEVRQQDGNYIVRADLPGINADDVTIEVTDAGLMIEGERKREREQEQGGVRRTEVQYGYFARLVPLPDGANVDQANARFENGVLEITIPMRQEADNRKQIPVQGSAGNSSSNTGSTPQRSA